MFVSLKGGTEELVEALVPQLTGELRLKTCVAKMRELDGRYCLVTGNGERIMADVIIFAIPSYTAAGLLRDMVPEVADGLDGIRYVSTGTVSIAFRRQDVDLLEGFGLVIPRSEKRLINAVTITSTKFDRRAPADHVLMRIFFGGSRSPQNMDVEDDILVSIVLSELEALLGIDAQPLFYRIFRWRRANPQYDVGHLDRVQAIEAGLPERIYVTGSPYRGIGLPDCVHQGQETAARLVSELSEETDNEVLSLESEGV
jgi:oxygen-dependent protoporphyrinogen oxidase